ncbi:MAG: hypothetical protein ACOX4O_08420 [Eubacteriales bacterium]|jgi:hypothetical protein
MDNNHNTQPEFLHTWRDGDKLYLWMQLLGFDVTQPDYGVGELLSRMKMQPHAVMLFVFHPDIIHLHNGMDEEVVFPPDFCASYGCARNHIRYRQTWTNYHLRGLVKVLRGHNIAAYLSVMGRSMNNYYHKEWLTENRGVFINGERNSIFMNVLKRLDDGSYYEDFFIKKCREAVKDYGLSGVHLSDCFCPVPASCSARDYSADFVDQFVTHAGLTLPEDIAAGMDSDSSEQQNARRTWIWGEHRESWIRFSAWRWNGFLKKLCASLAEINAKVSILGAYLTDPFETLYVVGMDLPALIEAGVDSVTLNVLPDSVRGPTQPELFHKLVSMVPLMGAHIGPEHLVTMIGVKDSTEEYDVLAHRPASLERTTYRMLGYQMLKGGEPIKRAASGLLVCLADGVTADQWKTLRGWFEYAYSYDVTEISGPMILWSETAHNNLLPEYIAARRWSPHKYLTELSRYGLVIGGVTKPESLDGLQNPLFVPNYDLLGESEKQSVREYNGAVVGTVPADFDWTNEPLCPQYKLTDKDVRYPQQLFAVIPDNILNSFPAEIDLFAGLDSYPDKPDTRAEYQGDLKWVPENYTPFPRVKGDFIDFGDILYFSKISLGFLEALKEIFIRLQKQTDPLTVNLPYTLMRRGDGSYLLYVYNPYAEYYNDIHVQSRYPIRKVTNITDFPILPAKYAIEEKLDYVARYEEDFPFSEKRVEFFNKVAPDGAAVFKIELDGV